MTRFICGPMTIEQTCRTTSCGQATTGRSALWSKKTIEKTGKILEI